MLQKLTLVILFILVSISNTFSQVYRGLNSSRIMKNTSVLWINESNNSINYVKFVNPVQVPETDHSNWLKDLHKAPANVDFRLIRKMEDQIGQTHYRYAEYVDGFKIDGAQYIVHAKQDGIISANGEYYTVANLPSGASIAESQAFKKAKYEVPSDSYAWLEENLPRPQGELVLAGDYKNLKLAYKFDIYSLEPLGRYYVYVDAVTGNIIQKNDRIHHTSVTGTAHTKYHGVQSFTTDSLGATNFVLVDSPRSITTKDLNNSTSYGSAVNFTDANNIWTSTTNQDDAALDAHWGAGKTYDFFYLNYGLDSYNGLGASINSYVHYGNNYVNAFWDGSKMTYGDGNGTSYTALTSIDVVGHEITHAVTEYSANLVYSYESGALNESFSDVFGVAIDFYADPLNANWYMGDLFNITGNGFRDMSNPNAKSHPDTYLGTYWHTGSSDNGGVHTNSGVQNFWFYLLTQGGTGTNDNSDAYSVTGVGITDAAAIAYRNLSVYLTTNSQYANARFYAIQAAADLYGSCSAQEIATTEAWYAVGIGSSYANSVSSNFTASQTFYCTTPATVSFTNTSVNDSARIWDFGDASTDTTFSPSHTYTSTGTYTVTLITFGSSGCGAINDTLVQTNYITVTNTGGPVTASCTPTATSGLSNYGIFNFSLNTINNTTAGAIDGYQDYTCSNSTTVSEGDMVNISVNMGGLNQYYEVYIDYNNNGSFSSSERVFNGLSSGIQSGVLAIPMVSSNNIPLRVRVIADGVALTSTCTTSVNTSQIEDYSIIITPLSGPPVADFVGSPTSLLTGGSSTFSNLSSGLPTSYSWSFPGGTPSTSTATNPVISYAALGSYDVTLIATNAFGSDTITKTNYITVTNQIFICGAITSSNSVSGFLYDSGGPTGNYSNNQNCGFLIQPTCADSIFLSFSQFNTESGYDYIRVYDGPSTSSPQILYATGSSLPATVVALSGSMYVYFHSDVSVTSSGFASFWSTVQISSIPPVASFLTSNSNPPIGGTVNFTDQTTNSPIGWNWDFGNGNASVLQNPSNTYLNSGAFPVQLIASTCGFSDTTSSTVTVQESPTISVNPISISHTFTSCVDSITFPVTIYNTGAGDLVLTSAYAATTTNFIYPFLTPDTVAIGDSITFDVILSALGLPIGTYQDSVAIASNDSANPIIYIPVNMVNNGTAYLDVDSSCVAFDTVLQFLGDSMIIHVINPGCDTLHVTGLTLGTSSYSLSSSSLTIPPFSSDSVWVSFVSTSLGWKYDTLSITTNANDSSICISGYMEGSPIISTQPDTLNVTIANCNDSVVVPMWVYNTGDGDLIFDASGNGNVGNGTLNVVSWKYAADLSTGPNGEYQNTINAINAYYTNYNLTETLTTDTLVMQSLLANAQLLLIPEQETAVGTVNQQMANTIQNFVSNGGWVIICGTVDNTKVNDFGILNISTSNGISTGTQVIVDALSPLLNNTTLPIVNTNATYLKGFTNPGFNIITSYSGITAVGDLDYGSGKVIWISFDYYQYNSNSQKIIANAVEWASTGANITYNWIYASPDSGVVAPGDSMLIYVTVNGTGMVSGTYQGSLDISSNDPVTPNWVVPVNLTIIGMPELALSDSCVAFDSTLQFTHDTAGIWVYNTGCDTLSVSNIISSSADVTFDTTAMEIPPYDSLYLTAYFSPDTAQMYAGTITIFNNAGDSTICFTGEGSGAPVISLNPDSINVTITSCNDSIIIPVTVYNTGLSGLDVTQITTSGVGGGSVNGTPSVAIFRNSLAWGYNSNVTNLINLGYNYTVYSSSQMATVLIDTFDLIIFESQQVSNFWSTYNLNKVKFETYLTNGGSIQYNLATSGNYGAQLPAGVSYVHGTSSVDPIVDTTHAMFSGCGITTVNGSYASHGYVTNAPTNADTLTLTNTGNASTIEYQYGTGHVMVTLLTLEHMYYHGFSCLSLISNAIQYNVGTGGSNWMYSMSDSTYVLVADSQIVNIVLSSVGLSNGVYTGFVQFESNDPVNPILNLPVVFNVIGLAQMAFSDSCVVFDTTMQFTTDTTSIWIYNNGCDTLDVTSVVANNGDISFAGSSFIVQPSDSFLLDVYFTPDTLQSYSGTITFSTNIGDSTICFTGYVEGAPHLVLNPDSIFVTLNCSDSIVVPITVSNTGTGPLTFNVNGQGGSVSNSSLDVFAWTYGTDMVTEYPNTISAINANFTNYTLTQSNTTSLVAFQNYLANTDVLLLPEAESGSYTVFSGMSAAITNFANNGGWVIMCGSNNGYVSAYGLFMFSTYTNSTGTTNTVIDASSPLLNNVVGTLISPNATYLYTVTSTGFNSVTEDNGYTTTGDMDLGSGKLIYLGFDFFQSNTNSSRIIGNAFEWALTSGVNWTYAANDTGNVAAGDSTIINIVISGDSIAPGTYQTSYVFASNDPANPYDTLYVVMVVVGVPELWVADTCINIGTVQQFVTVTDSMQISNLGCDTMQVTSITTSSSTVTATVGTLALPDGDSTWLTVNVTPTQAGSYLEYVTINTNGNDTTICVSGTVLGSSVINVDPVPSGSMRLCDTVLYRTFYIQNMGFANLNWSYTQSGSMPVLTPSTGVILPNDSVMVTASITNPGTVGSYVWNVDIVSNAPQTPNYAVPLYYQVTNEPCVDYSFNIISNCDGVVAFANASSGSVVSYAWDFDDGTTDNVANPVHTFISSGTYNVQLIVCGVSTCDTLSQTVVVSASNTVLGASCYPFNNAVTVGTGITTVQLNTLSNASSNSTEGFQDFSCSMGTQLMLSITENFMVTTTSGTSQIVKAWIDYNNDGIFAGNELVMSSIATGNHSTTILPPANAVLNTPLRMRIKSDLASATTTGPCDNPTDGQVEDYFIEVVPNNIPPDALFTDSVSVDCSGIVVFTDMSTQNPTSWNWDFGDGTTSTIQNPIHQYAVGGIYAVKLVATNANGSDSITQNIVANRYLIGISYSGFMNANQVINFAQTGSSSISWDWNFGDGNTSTIANPSNTYAQDGTYYVTLHTENTLGCKASFTDTLNIEFPLGIDEATEGYAVSLRPNPNNGNFKFKYKGASSEVKLVLVSASGQTIFTKEYQVNGSVEIDFNNLNLAAGSYFLNVEDGEHKESLQFVVR